MPRESDNDTALKNDTIQAVSRFTPFSNPQKNEAVENSKKRISANTDVKTINDMNVKIDKVYEGPLTPVPLNFDAVYLEVNRMNSLWKEIKDVSEKEYPLNVERNSVDIGYQEFDDYLRSSNTEKIKSLKTNFPVTEAINIINDLNK